MTFSIKLIVLNYSFFSKSLKTNNLNNIVLYVHKKNNDLNSNGNNYCTSQIRFHAETRHIIKVTLYELN
jgi:carbonic anhydrase